jgi:hypothetical protein
MTLLTALIYLLAGILCINRPSRIVQWIGKALKRSGNFKEPEWLKGRGILFFIRLIGFLAFVNAVTLFYTAKYS